MNGCFAFLKKEFMENIRNYRLFIMLTLFLILGMFAPLTAKFMPDIISAVTTEIEIIVKEPVALDSWEQFHKNVSQLGMSIMLIIFSSSISSEYNKGTLINMVTKGLSRPAIILSKFTAIVTVMTISYWICFCVTYGYTTYLWTGVAIPNTIFAAFALWIMGIMYISILIFCCVIFRQAFSSIVLFLVISSALGLLGIPKPLTNYSPSILTSRNLDLLSGNANSSEFIFPIIVALIISAGFLLGAIALFNKKQL